MDDSTNPLLGSVLWDVGLNNEIVSRLNPEDVDALRSSSRVCRNSIPRRRSPFVVLTDVIGSKNSEGVSKGLYSDYDNVLNPDLPSPLCRETVEDFSARKLVLNFGCHGIEYNAIDYVSSCRDLMCFYTPEKAYVYSPTTAQYLPFDLKTDLGPNEVRVGIVYIASMRAYKAVMLEVLPPPPPITKKSPRFTALEGLSGYHPPAPRPTTKSSLRITSLTVVQEEDDEHHHHLVGTAASSSSSSWELVSETDLPSLFGGVLGNLIGLNGAVYAIIHFQHPLPRYPYRNQEVKVLSLDLEQKDNNKLKIFSLPPCCYDDDGNRKSGLSTILSQVKDHLCFPHTTTTATTTPTIDLWLLPPQRDRNTSSWFKGYTIPFNSPSRGRMGQLVYFPHPAAPAAPDDDDWAGGLFLFQFKQQLFQYDLHTKKAGCLLQDGYKKKLHVVSSASSSFPLKNGLRCPRLPPPSVCLPKPKEGMPRPPELRFKRRKLDPPSSQRGLETYVFSRTGEDTE